MQTTKKRTKYLPPQKVSLLQALEIFNALEKHFSEHPRMKVQIPGLRNHDYEFPNNTPGIVNRDLSNMIVERQQQLDAVSLGITSLDYLKGSIECYMEDLDENRNYITKSLDFLYRARASALWRFPVEVLSEIFMYCLPTDITQLSPVYSRKAPMLLTKICRRWRQVALNLPSLWCRIHLSGDYDKSYGYKWLRRAREYPLHISLYDFYHTGNGFRPAGHPLRPYFNRIVSLETDSDEDASFLMRHLTSIRELTIHRDLYRIDLEEFAESLTERSSTLRSLKFELCVNTWRYSHHFDPVWPHLTNLETHVNESLFRRLFELGRNLSSLTIQTSFINAKKRDDDEPIVHTKLRSLCIIDFWRDGEPPSIPIMFHALTLPNLRVLEVSCETKHVAISHEIFKQFLTRSNCPLTSLTFGAGMVVTDEEIAEYRVLVPSLLEVVRKKGCLGGEQSIQ